MKLSRNNYHGGDNMHDKIPYGELGQYASRIKAELQKRIRGDLDVFYIEDTLYVRIFYSSTHRR